MTSRSIPPSRVATMKRVAYETVLRAIGDGELPASRDEHDYWQVRVDDARAWQPRRVGRPKGSGVRPEEERRSIQVFLRLSPLEERRLRETMGDDSAPLTTLVRKSLGLDAAA